MRHSRSFPAQATSVGAARRFTRAVLGNVAPEVIEPLELMVSELTTNTITHAHTAFELTITTKRDAVEVEVTDSGAGAPTVRSPGPDEMCGRGLRIVELLSDSWEIRRAGQKKTVWFSLASPATASAQPSDR